jgi:hypothetical protein
VRHDGRREDRFEIAAEICGRLSPLLRRSRCRLLLESERRWLEAIEGMGSMTCSRRHRARGAEQRQDESEPMAEADYFSS